MANPFDDENGIEANWADLRPNRLAAEMNARECSAIEAFGS